MRIFYKNLCSKSSENETLQENLLNSLDKTISDKNKTLCNSPITLDDVQKSIRSFSNNKSPRTDGLTPKF